jgi:DNA polymerase I-like protein with 3'-5' exonuclease and polymerase domains
MEGNTLSDEQPIVDATPAVVPAKKVRKPRVKSATPKEPKPKKVKPARDLRTVFREKIAGLTPEKIKKPWMAEKVFRIIDNAADLEVWAENVLSDPSRFHAWAGRRCPVLAVDTENTSLDTRIFVDFKQLDSGDWALVYEVRVEIAGVCLSADGIEGVYIPINHEKGANVPREHAARILQRLFDGCHLVFYNGKYDREVCRITLGISFKPYPHFEDVQVLKYINDPKADLGDKGSFSGDAGGLKALSETVLGIEQIEIEEIAKVRAHKFDPATGKNTLKMQIVPFTWVPVELALWYAAADAICTWLLWDRMKDLARSRSLIHHIDHELIDTLSYVERQRFLVDVSRQRRTARWHGRVLADLRAKLGGLAVEAGWAGGLAVEGKECKDAFNPGSPKQLAGLLFRTLGFKPYITTDSGQYSTNKETLVELVKQYPDNEFLKALQEYRELAALHPDNLRYDPKDNSARLYLKQNVVAGGRLSGAGGTFEKDGGLEWNPQGVKKLEPDDFWKVRGNVLEPDSVPEHEIEEHPESDLHPSCFREDKGVVEKAPGVIKNHIGLYQDYAICLVPKCTTCKDKFGVLIEDTSLDANQVVNLRVLFRAADGWTFFSIDYCLAPSTRLLTSDLRWKRADEIVKGEELIGFDENPQKSRYGRRRLRGSNVLSTKKVRLPCVRITTNSGSFVVSENHGWLVERATGGRKRVRGKQGWTISKDLQAGDKIARLCDPWEEDRSYDAGYLNGLFDGEGWATATGVGIGQKKGPVLDKAKRLLRGMGYTVSHDTPKDGVDVLRVLGGRNASLRFLGSVRPERLIKNARKNLWEGKTCSSRYTVPDEVISVEHVGVQDVIAVKTTTKTFIAEGLLSHNCNIEVRTAANLSGEPELQNIFLYGDGDHHALTASKIFPEYSDPTSKMYKAKSLRAIAKTINFALQYGGTSHAIYKNMVKNDPTITKEKCDEMVAKYWEGVPKFKEWCDGKQLRVRESMVCETKTGRVIDFRSAMEAKGIHVPSKEERQRLSQYYDLKREAKRAKADKDDDRLEKYENAAQRLWKNPDTGVRNAIDYNQFIGYIQRVAVNCPVQGLSGDFMRIALNRIKKWIERDPGVQAVFRLHGSVHDEIDVSIKNEYIPFVLPRLTRLMKLRKYHEREGWIVPIECDAEYGHSWDVDYNVTDKKDPAAYTKVEYWRSYVPSMFSPELYTRLYRALVSGDGAKVDRAKEWLKVNLHPKAFQSAQCLFETNAKAGWPLTDPREIKRVFVALLQLHEYWTIDHVPDSEDAALETLAQYEGRMGIYARDERCPEFGYLGAIPLGCNVVRPTPEILGDAPVEFLPLEPQEVQPALPL